MYIEVSIGEAIDKLSILEIKLKKITNNMKQAEIRKEIEALDICKGYILKYNYYYKLLIYVNSEIWRLTDIIKSIDISNTSFASISNSIFEFNQKRFRLKKLFNILLDSNIKEQKSYNETYCKIIIDNIDIFYNKISEINYLLLEYDNIIIDSVNTEIIIKNIQHPSISYNIDNVIFNKIIKLKDYSIEDGLINIFKNDLI